MYKKNQVSFKACTRDATCHETNGQTLFHLLRGDSPLEVGLGQGQAGQGGKHNEIPTDKRIARREPHLGTSGPHLLERKERTRVLKFLKNSLKHKQEN